MISRKMFLLLFFLIPAINTFSQGAWNIKYLPLDSLSPSFLEKEIRIDFKRNIADAITSEIDVFSVRRLLSHNDTVSIIIRDKSIQFVEQWQLYVDHGVLSEQHMKRIDSNLKKPILIKKMFLKSIDQDSLALLVWIYEMNNKLEELLINIPRELIKGILVNFRS